MPDNNQHPQPPPEIVHWTLQPGSQQMYQPERRVEDPRYPEESRVVGWARTSHRHDRFEVYWKGRSDVMVLIAHTLSKENAEAMCRDIVNICKRYNGIPFIEVQNVRNKPVEVNEQTKGNSQGSMGESPQG